MTTSVLYRMDQKENNQIQISLKNQIQIKPLFATTVQRSTCVSHKLPNHHLYLTIQKKPHSIYKSLTRCLTYHKTWSVKNKVIKIKWTWMTLDKLNIKFFFKKNIQYNLELIFYFWLNYQFSSLIIGQNFNSFPQLLMLSI